MNWFIGFGTMIWNTSIFGGTLTFIFGLTPSWWQLTYFSCSPRKFGKMNPIWWAYFSDGLVQPPTRIRLCIFFSFFFPGDDISSCEILQKGCWELCVWDCQPGTAESVWRWHNSLSRRCAVGLWFCSMIWNQEIVKDRLWTEGIFGFLLTWIPEFRELGRMIFGNPKE